MATFDPPGLQHLAPVWVNELRRQGVDSDRTLALWRDDHLEPPPPDRIAMLQRWARGETRIVDLTRDEGITHSRVQAMLKDAALRLIAPHLEDLPRWEQARSTGVSPEVIAHLSNTVPEVVDLALDGWPARRNWTTSGDDVAEAHRRWRAGASLLDVAEALGVSEYALTQTLRSGESALTPRRLETADLRSRFGWTPSAVSLYRRRRVLPAPDGHEKKSAWWWESTLDSWAAERDLLWCQQCRRAFMSRRGLTGHRTQVHESTLEESPTGTLSR